jgi:K+-transporting ATPase ATPase A chain
MLVIGIPLGKYLAKMFAGEKVWTDFMKPARKRHLQTIGH